MMRRSAVLLPVLLLMALAACTPTVRGAGPAHFPPALEHESYRTEDGTRLALQSWLPKADARLRAVVVGLHGYGDYANNFLEVGRDFADRGIAVYAFDQRGFGRSPTRGLWAGHRTLAEDAKALVRLAAKQHPGVPVYLCGISMGGAVAMLASASLDQRDLAGTILVTPAVWGREHMPWPQTALLWLVSHTLPALPLTGRGLKIQPTDNIDLMRRLWRDPHMTRSSRTDMIHGMVDLMDAALDAAPHLIGRYLVLTAAKDEIIPSKPLQTLKKRLPQVTAEKRRFVHYDDGYHMLLRGLSGSEVRAGIADWILGQPVKNLSKPDGLR